jgi:uncharacterized protein
LLALRVIGIAHAVFIWWGDIVAHYAVLGLLLLPATRWTPRTLARVGIALLLVPAIGLAAVAGGSWGFAADPSPAADSPEEDMAAWGAWIERLFDSRVFAHGSYLDITFARLRYWAMGTALFGLIASWRVAGLMLLGMAGVRQGWLLDPAAQPARVNRMIAAGLAFGAPLQAAAVVFGGHSRFAVVMLAALALDLGSLGMSAAYAGLVARFLESARCAGWVDRLEAVGRTALSNYLFQSVAGTLLFYAYGFGLFGTLGRAALWGVVGLVWAVQVGLSVLSLRHFHGGPVEWLWRTLAYGAPPPFLRRSPRVESTRLPV